MSEGYRRGQPAGKSIQAMGAIAPGYLLDLLEEADEVVGMLLLGREDLLHHALGGGVAVAEVVDDLAVAVDRDALGDEVFLDHVLERFALHVLRVRARGEAFGRE